MTLGELIRKTRKENKMTQQELADLCHMSVMSVRRYESNERIPKVTECRQIANTLGLSANELITFLMLDNFERHHGEESERKEKLCDHFDKLNDAGQQKVVAYASDLEGNPQYQRIK